MSGSVNKVILVGNAGRDPEVRTMTNGGKVAEIRLATSESWKDKTSGERQEKTEWHSVQVFNEGLIGIIERFVKKGTKLYIEGAIQTRKYQVDGQDKYTTEIILRGPGAVMTMLSGSGEGGEGGGDMSGDRSGGGQRGGQSQGGGQQRRAAAPAARDDFDDDVPF
jgi:single-strand DNA-binding protein